ncbi:hypothetical protein R9X47_11245 [Wukongibacter baidiensis]|uniref:hypothetical protein n=1 Tax=Wukongibacter baidiensis TaxID=1723361 RepID=UPI003D7F8734
MKLKKFLAGLCVAGMIFSQGIVAFAAVDVYFDYESNNTMSTANKAYVDENEYAYLCGVVSQDDNDDWFRVRANYSGELDVLLMQQDDVDIDVFLHDKNGNEIAVLTGEMDRIRDLDVRAGEYYYIHVEHISGTQTTEPYKVVLMPNYSH